MDLKGHKGILLIAFGVAAGFLWLAVATVRNIWPGDIPDSAGRGRAMTRRERDRLAEKRRRGEETRRRRLDALAADPARRTYAERIRRGEAWSDEQIAYDLDAGRLATCEHLAPIEREMRASGIEVRLALGHRIDARCLVDAAALRARFPLPTFVEYSQPRPTGIAFENPLPAQIACAEHASVIDVVHPLDATTETPLFPAGATSPVLDASADGATDPFTRLRARVLSLARRIEAPADLIPTFRQSVQSGLPHIEIDGDTYHYVHEDRGVVHERFTTTSLDELLYHVFRDVAWSMSSSLARPHRKPGEDFRRAMYTQQLALLHRLGAEWASRCEADHQATLAEYPFVDDA